MSNQSVEAHDNIVSVTLGKQIGSIQLRLLEYDITREDEVTDNCDPTFHTCSCQRDHRAKIGNVRDPDCSKQLGKQQEQRRPAAAFECLVRSDP